SFSLGLAMRTSGGCVSSGDCSAGLPGRSTTGTGRAFPRLVQQGGHGTAKRVQGTLPAGGDMIIWRGQPRSTPGAAQDGRGLPLGAGPRRPQGARAGPAPLWSPGPCARPATTTSPFGTTWRFRPGYAFRNPRRTYTFRGQRAPLTEEG